MSSPIKGTVQDVQNDVCVVVLEDGQTVRLPMSAIEGSAKVGSDVFVMAVVPGGEDAGRQAVAQHLLNEIIGSKKS